VRLAEAVGARRSRVRAGRLELEQTLPHGVEG
jgi:hypothetical protein